MLSKLSVLIILQCIYLLDLYVVYFKLIQYYMPIIYQ